MCGIFGLVSPKIDVNLKSLFKEGLIASTVRGFHGTGVMAIDKTGSIYTSKDNVLPTEFITEHTFSKDNIFNVPSIVAYVGHVRQATHGKKAAENCHPFESDDLTLIHNGTLVRNKNLHWSYGEVDSLAATNALSKAKTRSEIITILEGIEGAFVFIWHNLEDNTLNFARNSERRLYFAGIKDSKSSFIFASEGKMIDWLADRNSIDTYNPALMDAEVFISMDLTTFATTTTAFKALKRSVFINNKAITTTHINSANKAIEHKKYYNDKPVLYSNDAVKAGTKVYYKGDIIHIYKPKHDKDVWAIAGNKHTDKYKLDFRDGTKAPSGTTFLHAKIVAIIDNILYTKMM